MKALASIGLAGILGVTCGCALPRRGNCEGSPSAESFTISVPYVQASPLDPHVDWVTGYDFETWDWDGNVPDDWINASAEIASFLADLSKAIPDPRLERAADAAKFTNEILEFTDEHAPELVEPFTEPDLYVGVSFASPTLNGGEFQDLDDFNYGDTAYDLATGTGVVLVDDSLQGEASVTADLPFETDDDVAQIDVFDEDLVVDDYVGGFTLDRSWLRENAGCGPTLISSSEPETNGVWGIVVEVEAHLDRISFE